MYNLQLYKDVKLKVKRRSVTIRTESSFIHYSSARPRVSGRQNHESGSPTPHEIAITTSVPSEPSRIGSSDERKLAARLRLEHSPTAVERTCDVRAYVQTGVRATHVPCA